MGAPRMSLAQIGAVARQRAQSSSVRTAQLAVLSECFLTDAEDPAQVQDPGCDPMIELARAGTATGPAPARQTARRIKR